MNDGEIFIQYLKENNQNINENTNSVYNKCVFSFNEIKLDIITLMENFYGRKQELYTFVNMFSKIPNQLYLSIDISRILGMISMFEDPIRQDSSLIIVLLDFLNNYWSILTNDIINKIFLYSQ